MATYYLTFGPKYATEEHPHFPHAHPDGWVEITANSELDARNEVYNCLGYKWAFIYNDKNFNPVMYSAGRIATLDEIKEQYAATLFKPESSKNPMTISSEVEHNNKLTPEKMMVLNNMSALLSKMGSDPRMDKFGKKIDETMSNVLSGLSPTKETRQEDIEYCLNVKDKFYDFIEAIMAR